MLTLVTQEIGYPKAKRSNDPPDDQIPVLEGMHCRMPVSSDGALLEHRSGCSLETLPAKTDANNSHNLRWVGINDGSTVRTAAT